MSPSRTCSLYTKDALSLLGKPINELDYPLT